MAFTLGFHSLFIILGVGLSGLISMAELIGILKKNELFLKMARTWSYGFAIMFGVGTASGTAVAFELYLLWPTFMSVAVKVVALPFFMEVVFAFFPEAIFLPIYYYGWDKFRKPIHHWLTSLPIVFGSALSGFFITTVNSFMNTPAGFSYTVKNGAISVYNVNPIAAMFNPATPWETSHVISATYVGTAFMLASIYAYAILRGRKNEYTVSAFRYSVVAGFVSSIFAGITGSLSASFLSVFQPEKFAAMEALYNTQSYAYEKLFSFTIPIRGLMSFLAANRFSATLTGLNAFPRSTWPDVLLVHSAFDLMALFGFYFFFASAATIISFRFMHSHAVEKLSYYVMLIAGPMAYGTFLLGWIVTEEGRQPWIIYNIMTVEQGFTHAYADVPELFYAFLLFYGLLTFLTIFVLLRYYHSHEIQGVALATH